MPERDGVRGGLRVPEWPRVLRARECFILSAMSITVVIPSYRPLRAHLETLYRSLLAQRHADFEVIVVDDASGEVDYSIFADPRFRVIYQEGNRGPATCRNVGAEAARHEILFFTDTDCELAPDCLAQVARHMPEESILVGNTVTRVETPFGRAVALLGFPGGGILGFDRVWRVDAAGYAKSFSSCNVAFRREVFRELGQFNTTFPVAGGEDTVLARAAVAAGCRLRYLPDQVVYHVEKPDLGSFLRWQQTRGRGNYYIKQHVPEVGGYLKLRLWTFRNSFRAAGLWYFFPVFALLALSVLYQVAGFREEKRRVEGNRS